MSLSAVSPGAHSATWWLPDHPQQTVTGRYIVNLDGTTTIELFEDIQEKVAFSNGDSVATWQLMGPDSYTVLNGEADNKMISAFSVRLIGMSKLTGSTRVERRQPRYTIESPFDSFTDANTRIRTFRFRPACLSRLSGWHGEPDDTCLKQPDKSNLYTLTLATNAPKPATIEGARVLLSQEYHRAIASRDDRITISKSGLVTISLDEGLTPVEVVSRYVRPLMYMFSLMSGHPEGLSQFEFSSEDCPWPNDDVSSDAKRQPLWMTTRILIAREPAEPPQPQPPLLLLELVDWQTAVDRWLRWSHEAIAELQLMSLLLDSSYPWVEAKFITCAQMIEGIHRKSFPVSDAAIEENRILTESVGEILKRDGSLNHKKRRRVRDALKYLYEPSLEKRIKELDAESGHVVSSLNDVDMNIVAQACGRLRNEFAHSLETRPISNLGSVQVAHATLSLIGFSYLFTKLGKSGHEAAAIVKQSRQGHYWAQVVSENWKLLIGAGLT